MADTSTPQEELKGYPSEAQLEEWRTKYGKIHLIVDPQTKEWLLLRKVKLRDLERASGSGERKKQKSFDFVRSIIANCKLANSENALNEDHDCIETIYTGIGEVIDVRDADIKNA